MGTMKNNVGRLLREALAEAEYNYHFGNLNRDDKELDQKKLKAYGSDNIINMSGRGTGHFGSGIYFSTYTCNEKGGGIDKDYGEYSDYEFRTRGRNPELTELPNDGSSVKAYRVDMDLYKNLYRVRSRKQADALFKTLKRINGLFYGNSDTLKQGKIPKGFSDSFLKLKHNMTTLGLDLPKYKEFLQIYFDALKDISYETKHEDKNLASLSTRIMEWNGFNGVNVSGIDGYDNTTHGSVIYDINKLSDKPVPVKDVDLFCDYDNKTGMVSSYRDISHEILANKKFIEWNKFNNLNPNVKLRLMKRYYHVPYDMGDMDDETKDIFMKTLPARIKSGKIKEFNHYIIPDMIKYGQLPLIYDPNIRFEGRTFLEYVLSNGHTLPKEIKQTIVNNINRELSDYEKDEMEYFIL